MASWGNPSVAVSHVTSGMETETQGVQLGVCLSKIGKPCLSALPHPDAADAVTQLCLLPAPAAAARPGEASSSLPARD